MHSGEQNSIRPRVRRPRARPLHRHIQGDGGKFPTNLDTFTNFLPHPGEDRHIARRTRSVATVKQIAQPDEAKPILLPFLKWAGGKRWLVAQHPFLLPSSYGTYVEPFLGSGAVFFHLRPKTALISDANVELMNTYREIRKNWRKVEAALKRHHRFHSAAYYYEERSRKHRGSHESAAQFIYLNRTCWNGLYRVNLRGEFNVPIGTKTAVSLATDNFEGIAEQLENAKLIHSDFENTIDLAEKNDFMFVDPPYITRHNFNGFIKYNDKIFSWEDQERLSDALHRAKKRGVKILVTNADHQSVRSLYHGLGKMLSVTRNSILAADSNNRGETTELAVTINFEPRKEAQS
jgi:DNA adenine methylase